MNTIHLKKNNRIFSILCAGLLLLAVFNLPIGYFEMLRIVIFLGAIFIVIENLKITHWLLIFILITILFNPIFPIYFYDKKIWIPIDVVCALLFLVEAIIYIEHKKEDYKNPNKANKKYTRDKIH